MTKNKLFTHFDPVSSKAYKQKIQFDLKGASYNDTLIWHSNEGIDIKPFYHRDETEHFPEVPGIPTKWHIGEDVFISDAEKAAKIANQYLEGGTEALYFTADAPFDAQTLFKNIEGHGIPFYFKLQFLDESFLQELIKEAGDRTIYLNIDLIGNLSEDGNWFHNLKDDHIILDNLLKENAHTLSINIDLYQNAGANMVQQLAYGLAHANEYLLHLENLGVSTPSLTFQVSVGSNYFFEIGYML